MFGDSITIGQAVIVCVFSLVVVFAVLLAISYLIDLIALIVSRAEKKKKAGAAPRQAAQPEQPAAATGAGTDEAVLVAAALAAYLGTEPDRLVVRSIRRVTAEQTPWSQAVRNGSLQ